MQFSLDALHKMQYTELSEREEALSEKKTTNKKHRKESRYENLCNRH